MLIADTAGRLQTQSNLMDELSKVLRVIGKLDDTAPHEVLLVLDGSTGQNALSQARQFHKLINAVSIPSGGRVTVNDVDTASLNRKALPAFRQQIGTVYQDNKLLFDRSVHANVALPLEVAGIPPSESAGRVRAALEKVGLLKAEHLNPSQLSGGEQQRVAIARAVVNRPAVLIADEPTGNLDRELSRDIMRLFWELNQKGVTVLIATHDDYMVEQMEVSASG